MDLYRFCSHEEAKLLSQGVTITNTTNHNFDGKGDSASVGFCMTQDEPQKAWSYLKGIVTPDICLHLDIPEELLTKSKGKYVRYAMEYRYGKTFMTTDYKDEWCITELRPEWLKETIRLETFVSDYELEAARELENYKRKIYKTLLRPTTMTLEEKATKFVDHCQAVVTSEGNLYSEAAVYSAYLTGAQEALASQWRSVADKLPEDEEYVLIDGPKGVEPAVWNEHYQVWDGAEGDDYLYEKDAVRAWMPIPESPEIKKK